MFALVFTCLGLFASAKNGKSTKSIFPQNVKTQKLLVKKVKPTIYQVVYSCGDFTVTACCFSSYMGAFNFMLDNPAFDVCAAFA